MRITKAIAAAVALAALAVPGMAQAKAAPAARGSSSVTPVGVPSSQVGSLVLNAAGSTLNSSWSHNSKWGAECNNDPSYPAPAGKVTVDKSGYLDLTITGKTDSCAQALSPRSYTYGIFEARINVPAGTGKNSKKIADWPAFWIVNGDDWPTAGEIDAFEGLSGYDFASFHYGTSAATEQTVSTIDGSAPQYSSPIGVGWHTVDVVWTSSSVTIYYDGVKFTTFSGSYITHQPMNIVLTNTEGSYGLQPGSASTLAVQYVRVWNLKS